MRFHTGVQAQVSRRPQVKVIYYPSPTASPEVKVDVGGLGLWFTESEATDLGKQLIEAGISIRATTETEEQK